ncbi:MAG: glycosyltransferase family 2 protein [Nitrospirae bacterium]|nr:glycosyltransferase family 2 protein [Nitrospirota bacterium]
MTKVAPVSIVIPMRNESKSLALLLDGLEKQTLLPSEIIFVDTGSTDQSIDIVNSWWKLKGWQHGTCLVFIKEGAFPGLARNIGITHVTSQWIAFIDAGIVPDDDWLNALYQHVIQHGTTGVFGTCRFTGTSTIKKALCALSYGYNAIHPVLPSSIFHKKVFQIVGMFRSDLRSAEDIVWKEKFIDIYKHSNVCHKAIVHYNSFPDSILLAVKKWFVYGFNTIKAGVMKRQQIMYIIVFMIIVVSFIYHTQLGMVITIAYTIFRGILVPILKSKLLYWWKGNFNAFIITIPLGIILDLSKTIGFLTGYVAKIHIAKK